MKTTAYYVLLALLCLPLLAQQPAQPKVVFYGDYITYQWASAFAANPNWINAGNPTPYGSIYGGDLGPTGRFQTDVIDLHPAIVHILIGSFLDFFISDQGALYATPNFLSGLDALVKEAQAANIKVVLGTSPPVETNGSGYGQQFNEVIAAYGVTHNIPVIDYFDALCPCASLSTTNELVVPTAGIVPLPGEGIFPSTAGYAVMTRLAESVIPTVIPKLVTGWLSNVGGDEGGSITNGNTIAPPGSVLFTPIGYYSDGSQHPMINTNLQKATGTWTSSNPEVMYINQQGGADALSAGTTRIIYTSLTGLEFANWIMTVGPNGID